MPHAFYVWSSPRNSITRTLPARRSSERRLGPSVLPHGWGPPRPLVMGWRNATPSRQSCASVGKQIRIVGCWTVCPAARTGRGAAATPGRGASGHIRCRRSRSHCSFRGATGRSRCGGRALFRGRRRPGSRRRPPGGSIPARGRPRSTSTPTPATDGSSPTWSAWTKATLKVSNQRSSRRWSRRSWMLPAASCGRSATFSPGCPLPLKQVKIRCHTAGTAASSSLPIRPVPVPAGRCAYDAGEQAP